MLELVSITLSNDQLIPSKMWFSHIFLVSIIGYISAASSSHADANRNRHEKPVLYYAVRGSEPESKNARSIPQELNTNYDGLQSAGRLIPNAGVTNENYRTTGGILNLGLNPYTTRLNAYNPGLSIYNQGLNAYNPLLSVYNPLLNVYNPAIQPYSPFPMNPLLINPAAVSPLSQIGLANRIPPLGIGIGAGIGAAGIGTGIGAGIGTGIGTGIGAGIGTIPLNSGILNPYQLQGGLGINSQLPYTGVSPSPFFRTEAQSFTDRNAAATSGAFGNNATKRSPMIDPQSPYYTRLQSNQAYDSHTEREENPLDKKRNIGRSRSSSIYSDNSTPN